MLNFVEYKKKCYPNLSGLQAWDKYVKYVEGEEEIMQINKKSAPAVVNTFSFGLCVAAPPDAMCKSTPGCKQKANCVSQQEVENTMTTTNSEREYLARRLQNSKYDKNDEVNTFFKIHEEKSPRNFKELISWITEGKYELDKKRVKSLEAQMEEDPDHNVGYGAFDGIIWTGRGKFDNEAYNAAIKDMNKKYSDARDIVMTMDAEAGLKALQDFEAWQPKGKKH